MRLKEQKKKQMLHDINNEMIHGKESLKYFK